MLDTSLQQHRDLLAGRAVRLWGDGFELSHVADSGNAVFIASRSGMRFILRLTNPAYRSRFECEGELAFLLHLGACGCRVALPLPSRSGAMTEEAREGEAVLVASLFRWAPGLLVSPGERFWNRPFFQEWGRSLGEIHRAARTFRGAEKGGRWEWRDEVLMTKASELIPADEPDVRERFQKVMQAMDRLLPTDEYYGMTHGDFAPQNFRYDPLNGIMAFDFGNCCHHFFASDVAIAFTALRRRPEEEQRVARVAILAGYRQISPFTDEQEATLPLMHRLRVHYVYLSRLYKFGPHPDPHEAETLAALRQWVLQEG